MTQAAATAPVGRSATSRPIHVAEVFGPTLQGEGALLGLPTLFVRTGGCDFRCSWCDSLHAVLPEHRGEWTPYAPVALLERLVALATPPIWVTLSGGNPALQPGLEELVRRGKGMGYRFAMETQGTRWRDWLMDLDHLVVSPKPPSSGMPYTAQVRDFLDRALSTMKLAEVSIKVVIFDQADLEFAAALREEWQLDEVWLSVGNAAAPDDEAIPALSDMNHWRGPTLWRGREETPARRAWLVEDLLDRHRWLESQVLERRWWWARVTPQMHVLTHGNQRGV